MKKNWPSLPIVAAFDFDGTFTTHDSLIEFMLFTHGARCFTLNLIKETPAFLNYLTNNLSRQEMKECILTRFYSGLQLDEAKSLGKIFAETKLDSIIRPSMINRLKWHQNKGHRCVLISAGIDIYLEPWSKKYNFHQALTSICKVSSHQYLTGKLLGKNCWGPEKVVRLKEFMGTEENYILYAYGDSRGDRELLTMADYAFYSPRTL